MKIKDKLLSNATYLALNWGFNTLFFMVFWILLFKVLSPNSAGIVALALQTTTLLSTLSLFGLGLTAQKLISEMKERGQKNKIQNLISSSLKATLLSSIIFSICFWGITTIYPNYFKLSSDVVWIVFISIIAMSFSTILASIYQGFQNMKKIFLTTMYGDLCLIVSALLFLYLGFGYLGAILAFAFSQIVMALTRFNPNMFKTSKKGQLSKRIVLKYSLPASVVVLFMAIFNNSQYIILSSMKTIEIIGVYAVGMKIISVISILPTIFSSALFPITSGLSADKNGKSRQSYLISLVFRYTVFIVFPLALFSIVFSKYLVLFFSSAEYLSATTFLPVLILGGVFLGLATQFLSSLYAIGKPKKYRDSYVISTLVYLISAVTLTYYFSTIGMAISYLLSTFVMFIVSFIYIRRYLTISFPLKTVGKVIVGIAASFLFLFFMKPFIPNLLIAGIFSIISGLIYLGVLLKLNFYIEEDLKIFDYLSKRTPIFKNEIKKVRKYLSKFISKDL